MAPAYYAADICTAIVEIRHGPGQSGESMTTDLKASIERVLSAHPGIRYEVVAPPPAQFRNGRHQCPVFDLPLDQPIVSLVAPSVETVTGGSALISARSAEHAASQPDAASHQGPRDRGF